MLIADVFGEYTLKYMILYQSIVIFLYYEHFLVTATEAERKEETNQSGEWHRKCVKMVTSDLREMII